MRRRFMDEKNNVTKSHKVLLANRKNGAFSGVVDVLSFECGRDIAGDGAWDASDKRT